MRRATLCLAVGVFLLGSRAEAGDAPFATQNCDTNGSTERDISDATYLLNWLFLGGPMPVEYRPDGVNPATTLQNGDCNGESGIDISDALSLLNWLFAGGPAPVEETTVPDADLDGVPDSTDNCRDRANADQLDVDADLAGDVCDTCLDQANPDQADFDADLAGDLCDNCPQASNPGQEDTDEDGIGDACEAVVDTTYAGSLPPTTGRWMYSGELGVDGAHTQCAANWAGSAACTFEDLQVARASGELAGAHDTEGAPVTTYWVLDASRPGDEQCGDRSKGGIPWSYQTGHIADGATFVTLASDGSLSAPETGLVCASTRWVACCFQPPPKPTYVGSLLPTNGRWTYTGTVGVDGAAKMCLSSFEGSQPCTLAQLQLADSKGELLGAADGTGREVQSFWALDPSLGDNVQCGNSTATSLPWSYNTGHTGDGGTFVNLDAQGHLSAPSSGVICGQSKHVACCNP